MQSSRPNPDVESEAEAKTNGMAISAKRRTIKERHQYKPVRRADSWRFAALSRKQLALAQTKNERNHELNNAWGGTIS